MKIDQAVTLKSFLGTTFPPKNTLDNENYWKLIGQQGVIIDDREVHGRLLVLFKCNVDDYGLENHNPAKNSLWIRKSDLRLT